MTDNSIHIILRYSLYRKYTVYDSRARIISLVISYDTLDGMLAAARCLFSSREEMNQYIACCIQKSPNHEDISISHQPERWMSLFELEEILYSFGHHCSSRTIFNPWTHVEQKKIPSFRFVLTTSNGGQYCYTNKQFECGFRFLLKIFHRNYNEFVTNITETS